MQIKSFKAPTLKEAMANVKSELGVDAVILHTNKIKKGGILGFHAKENERRTKGSRNYSDALVENTITYDGKIGKHNINLLAGMTYEEENTNLLTGWGINFTEPYFLQLQNAKNTYSESFEYKHSLASYVGRLNYNYDEKYLLSAVVRRDGSSRLSKNS